jgi:aspartyl protease family protein
MNTQRITTAPIGLTPGTFDSWREHMSMLSFPWRTATLRWTLLVMAFHLAPSMGAQALPYAESQWIAYHLDPAEIQLVVRGKSLVYLTTKGVYKVAQPDGAAYIRSSSLLDCNRGYSSAISWQTYASDGVPLRTRELKQLQPAIDEALEWLADKSLNGTFVVDDEKRLCHVVSRWVHENANSPELPTLVQAVQGQSKRSIQLSKTGGVYSVGASINSSLTMQFIVDSGAAEVTLPRFVAKTLFASGALTKSDVLGSATYTLADGSSVRGSVVNLKSLSIGDVVIRNVRAAILPTDEGSLLLGQSALQKLGIWRIDATTGRLEISEK